jgi:hypothetical protein
MAYLHKDLWIRREFFRHLKKIFTWEHSMIKVPCGSCTNKTCRKTIRANKPIGDQEETTPFPFRRVQESTIDGIPFRWKTHLTFLLFFWLNGLSVGFTPSYIPPRPGAAHCTRWFRRNTQAWRRKRTHIRRVKTNSSPVILHGQWLRHRPDRCR